MGIHPKGCVWILAGVLCCLQGCYLLARVSIWQPRGQGKTGNLISECRQDPGPKTPSRSTALPVGSEYCLHCCHMLCFLQQNIIYSVISLQDMRKTMQNVKKCDIAKFPILRFTEDGSTVLFILVKSPLRHRPSSAVMNAIKHTLTPS